jgi:hypothetical protein
VARSGRALSYALIWKNNSKKSSPFSRADTLVEFRPQGQRHSDIYRRNTSATRRSQVIDIAKVEAVS